MSLFQLLTRPDSSKTQLAYKVKYWPIGQLGFAAKELIVLNKLVYLRKRTILANLDETKEHLFYNDQKFKIVWGYNNVPTEQEWNGKTDDWLIRCEFRWSGLFPDGPIVILSFSLPSDLRNEDIQQGAFVA